MEILENKPEITPYFDSHDINQNLNVSLNDLNISTNQINSETSELDLNLSSDFLIKCLLISKNLFLLFQLFNSL
jgi:hypothetical protein